MTNEYTKGIAYGGASILKNGEGMIIDEIVAELRCIDALKQRLMEVKENLKDQVAIAAIRGLVACGVPLDTAEIVNTSLSIAREYMLQRSEQ